MNNANTTMQEQKPTYIQLDVKVYRLGGIAEEAKCNVPSAVKEKVELIRAHGYHFEGEIHPNPIIGVTTTITHDDMGDLALVITQDTTDWEGHAVKVGEMIEKFDIAKADAKLKVWSGERYIQPVSEDEPKDEPRFVHFFTFGQTHTTTNDLPRGGRLADYWVTVSLPEHLKNLHRLVFVDEFTSKYCPHPLQFAFEYDDHLNPLDPEYYPKGELCVIDENGVR